MTVDLTPTWTIGSLDLTGYPYSVDASSTVEIGEPEMVVESVASLLADGDLERVGRHGNRTYVLTVYVEGESLAELARNEAALRSQIRRSGVALTHYPGDGFAPPSIYEVQTARLTPERGDDFESHLLRKYTLTLTCSSWARSIASTSIAALVLGAGAETVVDACNSATGWTGYINGSSFGPADPGWLGQTGSVWVYELFDKGPQYLALRRTGSFSVSTTPYIRINVRANEPLLTTASAIVDGVSRNLELISQRKSPLNSDEYEFIFATPNGSTTVTELTVTNYSYADTAAFGISEVARRGAPSPYTRQMTRIIETGGTERTPVSIQVQSNDGTTALGHTIVHTCPEDGSGYSPPLRRWRVSGNGTPTPEATRFSGAYEPTEPNAFVAQVPQRALPPGGYLLVARLWSSPAATVRVSWAAGTIVNSTARGQVLGETVVAFPVGGVWQTVPLGLISLPTIRALGPVTQIDIQTSTTDGTSTNIDEAWLFRMDEDCALTIVQNDASNLWLDSPSIESPVPRVWVGSIGDRSDARHPGTSLVAMGSHVLSPDGTAVFTAAETDYPKTSAVYYKRWHSNAAE